MSAVIDDDDEPTAPTVRDLLAELESLVDEIRSRPRSKRNGGLLVLKKDANKITEEWSPEDD